MQSNSIESSENSNIVAANVDLSVIVENFSVEVDVLPSFNSFVNTEISFVDNNVSNLENICTRKFQEIADQSISSPTKRICQSSNAGTYYKKFFYIHFFI